MRMKTNYQWPVLGDGNSVSGSYGIEMENVLLKNDEYYFLIEHKLENEILKGIVEDKKASFASEVICSATNYRQVFKSYSAKQEFIIPSNELRGPVTVRFYIITGEGIKDYDNPDFHEDYGSQTFDLGPSAVLAITEEEYKFDAKKRYAGIMGFRPYIVLEPSGDSEGPMSVNYAGDIIIIYIPNPEYDKISASIRTGNPDYEVLVDSSIAFPTIILALSETISEETANANKFWYQSLRKVADNAGKDWELSNIFEIAQIASKMPSARISDTLNRIMYPDAEEVQYES